GGVGGRGGVEGGGGGGGGGGGAGGGAGGPPAGDLVGEEASAGGRLDAEVGGVVGEGAVAVVHQEGVGPVVEGVAHAGGKEDVLEAIVVEVAGYDTPRPPRFRPRPVRHLLELACGPRLEQRVPKQHLVIADLECRCGTLLNPRGRRVALGSRPYDVGVLLLQVPAHLARIAFGNQPHVGVHVGDHEVKASIVVEVEGLGANGAPGGLAQRRPGDIGEGAIAVVLVQLAGPKHVGHEQVELAILVVVEDGDVAPPALARH